jgi:hypothetical protein
MRERERERERERDFLHFDRCTGGKFFVFAQGGEGFDLGEIYNYVPI